MKKYLIVLLALLGIAAVFGTIYVLRQAPTQVTAETYVVVANETDGPEQIFEKAFLQYAVKNDLKVTTDELRKVAEYMAETNLRGKAYWTDSKGVRHELWIGTGDQIVMGSDYSTFTISNAISDNQKKTVTIKFGFDDALKELNALRAITI